MERNFFESSHGKSAADGLFAVAKKLHQGQIIKQLFEMAKNFISSVNKTLGRVGMVSLTVKFLSTSMNTQTENSIMYITHK